jgi:hypothetical protein
MIHLSLNRLVCVGLMSVVTAGVYHTTRKSGEEILQMPGVSLLCASSDQCREQQSREQQEILARYAAKQAIANDLAAGCINVHEAGERIDTLNAGESAVAHRERRKNFSSGSAEAVGLVQKLLWSHPEGLEVVSRLKKELDDESASSRTGSEMQTTDTPRCN